MTDRSTLQRNKAVLWARDMITRANQCFLASGGTQEAPLVVANVSGTSRLTCSSNPNDSDFQSLVQKLGGKEVIIAGADSTVYAHLNSKSIVVYDLLEYYRIYVNNQQAEFADVPAEELVTWGREMLHKMAGSSLVLDQADTGAGKWTAAHFKPQPTMFDKLKSIIKG